MKATEEGKGTNSNWQVSPINELLSSLKSPSTRMAKRESSIVNRTLDVRKPK